MNRLSPAILIATSRATCFIRSIHLKYFDAHDIIDSVNNFMFGNDVIFQLVYLAQKSDFI